VSLASGGSLRAPLVVAADGAGSSIREWAGIAVRVRPYDHTAVVANFHCQTPHHGVARQWFFGDAVLALLPLPEGYRSLVWSCADAHARFLLELPGGMFAREVERMTGGEPGEMRLVTPAQGFPLRLQQVDTLVVPRVALVGDAAHTVHPLAGQGMNLGFGDCRELARVLAGRGPQPDLGDLGLLRRYQRARAEPIAAMRLATDGLFRLFASDRPGVGRLRNAGLGWVDRSPMLKRQLISAAIA
jgi:ubiquinone biosynthesis UbiH/UbiF/VisC/COQ6 family hydroxylase